jgi:hypothetical protein
MVIEGPSVLVVEQAVRFFSDEGIGVRPSLINRTTPGCDLLRIVLISTVGCAPSPKDSSLVRQVPVVPNAMLVFGHIPLCVLAWRRCITVCM